MTHRTQETIREQGREAARRGWERRSPYINHVGEALWYEGFDSVRSLTVKETS